jgi:hypothetical protein
MPLATDHADPMRCRIVSATVTVTVLTTSASKGSSVSRASGTTWMTNWYRPGTSARTCQLHSAESEAAMTGCLSGGLLMIFPFRSVSSRTRMMAPALTVASGLAARVGLAVGCAEAVGNAVGGTDGVGGTEDSLAVAPHPAAGPHTCTPTVNGVPTSTRSGPRVRNAAENRSPRSVSTVCWKSH